MLHVIVVDRFSELHINEYRSAHVNLFAVHGVRCIATY